MRPRVSETTRAWFQSGSFTGAIALRFATLVTATTALVLGAEKWGLSPEAAALVDQAVTIPMRGMVQSLNVSVATATLLFEALRQRQAAGLVPEAGEGLEPEQYRRLLFEWAYPQVAAWCAREGRPYPALDGEGAIAEDLPRTVKLRC